jgi:hypothetical protein
MNSSATDGIVGVLVFLVPLAGIVVTIFWMVVAWRAMRAHERLASAAETLSRNRRSRRATKRTEAEDVADRVRCLSAQTQHSCHQGQTEGPTFRRRGQRRKEGRRIEKSGTTHDLESGLIS